MGINQSDIKKLFSLSAGRCNICRCSLIEDDVLIGEMAHVIARSSDGPRGIDGKSNINTYDNLILLCANHHKVVDSKPVDYSVERLLQIKKDHEEYVKTSLDNTSEHFADLSSLNTLFEYIPILKFRGMALGLPHKISIDFDARYMFEAFVQGNPQSYPFWDHSLTQYWSDFIHKMDKLNFWLNGNLRGVNLVNDDNMFSGEPFTNIYVSNNHGDIVLNKAALSWEQINLINENISNLVREFLHAHTTLVDYIRYNFKNIKW
ncbi:HNH endonuclease signature motif containing protein [Pseudoalteromonas sp. 20-MNA-CIBAN-0454]|uniref:HNH endonuclease signature motif containing protein n=1 Tax=Pseudoalteromonas sp. 20-MNA-CIBAN-0454 TaxID=3140424 RepID=UPI003325C734